MNEDICGWAIRYGWRMFLSIGIGTEDRIFIITEKFTIYRLPSTSLNNLQLTSTETSVHLKVAYPNVYKFFASTKYRHYTSVIAVNGMNLITFIHFKYIEDNFVVYNLDQDKLEYGWDFGNRGNPIILLSFDKEDPSFSIIISKRVYLNQVRYNYTKKVFEDFYFVYHIFCLHKSNTTEDRIFILFATEHEHCEFLFFHRIVNGFMFKKNLYLFTKLDIFIIFDFQFRDLKLFSFKKINYSQFFACDRLDTITTPRKYSNFFF